MMLSRFFLNFAVFENKNGESQQMFGPSYFDRALHSLFFVQIDNRSCLRGPNEQKVAISLHQFEVIHGALVAQKSDHISCKMKVKVHEKKKVYFSTMTKIN